MILLKLPNESAVYYEIIAKTFRNAINCKCNDRTYFHRTTIYLFYSNFILKGIGGGWLP